MVSAWVLVLSVINGILGFVGTLANFFVVFVVYKNQELQTELNLLIASLSSADFTVSLIAQPMYIVFLNGTSENNFKDIFELIALIGLHASFNSLTGITLNRMAVILCPFSYSFSHHRKRLYASIIFGIWFSSIGLAYYFTTSSGKLIQPYVHTLMFSMFVLSYACIFRAARRQMKKISSQFQSVAFNHNAAKLKRENSAAKTSAILVSSSLVCFFPDIVFDYMRIVDEMRFSWSFTLLFVSSAVNPCIYVWRNERFRTALWHAVRCLPLLRNRGSSNRVHPLTVDARKNTTRSGERASSSPHSVDTRCGVENLE